MEHKYIRTLLTQVQRGSISVSTALDRLKDLPFEDLGYAHVDHHRAIRKGYPEAIFCQNKTPEQVVGIARAQLAHGDTVFGTRADHRVMSAVQKEIPKVVIDETARCFWRTSASWKQKKTRRSIVICSAGTADLPVVMEAKATASILGHTPVMIRDVGVAGIHRLFSHRKTLDAAGVIIAVAGMEGALPSVIAGYVSCPVIGVPTSVGYGSHLGGLVPLFAMLNSCATGLTVVNIDNGFGAACSAVGIISQK